MLTFESPFYEIENVIVFRDYSSPTTFHYLAGPPHLTKNEDGNPNLLLLRYKTAIDAMTTGAVPTRDQLGGAFLMFGVDCGIPEATKNAIKNKLQSVAPKDSGEISLVPVLYTKGKVSVIALDQQTAIAGATDDTKKSESKFVRGILGSATPSLLQDQRAIFSISLTPDAATLIEQAYKSDLSPIGVMYELEFAGLRPAIAIKAHVDMSRVYESLKMGLHAGVRTGPQSGSGGQDGTSGQSGSGSQGRGSSSSPGGSAPSSPAPAGGSTPSSTTSSTSSGSGTSGTSGGGTSGTSGGGTSGSGSGSGGTSGGGASGTGVYVSADLDFTLEKLRQEEAIKLEIVREQEGASVDQMQQAAMQLLKDTILNQFFAPAMSSTPAPSVTDAAATASQMQKVAAGTSDINKGVAGSNAKTQVDIGFQLQYKKEEELKTADFDFSVIAPETRTHAPNGFFSALLGNTDASQHIKEINLDDPFFKVLEVDLTTTDDFQSLDIQAITVDMQYRGTTENPSVAATATFTPTKKDLQRFMASIESNDFSYRRRINYSFGQSDEIASQTFKLQTPWQTTTSRALIVHPPEDVPMIHVYLEQGVVDWDVVAQIETHLMYEDTDNDFRAERIFMINKDSKRQEWIVRLTNPQANSYKVQHRWFLKDLSQIRGKVETHTEAHLFVADPFLDRLPITVDPHVDPANVGRINVELLYEDQANNFVVRKQVELDPPFKRATATIPIVDSKKREYTYTVSLVKPNGQAENHEPKLTDQLSIIITEGGVYLDVDVKLIGKLDSLGIDALQLDLQAEPLDGNQPKIESHLFLPSEADRFTQRLLLRADRSTEFQYRTLLMTKGKEIDSDWVKHQSKILLLPLQNLLKADAAVNRG